MILEITSTTDGRHVGTKIDTDIKPVVLDADEKFMPEKIWSIGPNVWRLSNSNYIIDAKE